MIPLPDRDGRLQPRLRLTLFPRGEAAVRGGHPWVFAASVKAANREGAAGEIAVIYDRHDRFLAFGLFDPASPIRVRILHTGKPVAVGPDWWRARLEAAVARRLGMFGDDTTGWRWISGESDAWPGMVLDRFGGTLVWKVYSAAWLPWIGELAPLIRNRLRPDALVLRLSRNVRDAAQAAGVAEGFLGPAGEETVGFLENGLRLEAAVVHGQKTGFFLDQRENRRRVQDLAAGRDVLNAFSFTGGFSLYAARGGARSVTDLDISRHALDGARRHFALNAADPAVRRATHLSVQADAFEWLADGDRSRKFGLVVTDPPSLAIRESGRAAAVASYERLAASAVRRLLPGGILVAASCSAHVTRDEFADAVTATVRRRSPDATVLWTSDHPDDHPATIPEARYLKCIALRTGNVRRRP